MKATSISALTSAILLALSVQACSQPGPCTDRFISCSEIRSDWEGKYRFPVELNDPSAHYSTSIVVRYDWSKLDNRPLTLDIYITSPSGENAVERVELSLSESGYGKRHEHGTVRDARWPYRENITVDSKSAGIWKIAVRPSDRITEEAVLGIGFSYRKN